MLNQVIVVGNLGKEPNIRVTKTGHVVVDFSVATKVPVKTNGKWENKTEWVNVVCFDTKNKFLSENLKKGSQVLVVGRITTDTWEKDGETHYRTYVFAQSCQLLGKKEAKNEESSVDEVNPFG